MGTPTSDDSDRPLDPGLADMGNNFCGTIEGVIDPDLVAARLSSLGNHETAESRIDEASSPRGPKGRHYSYERFTGLRMGGVNAAGV
ncbi:hypothetical protein [Streptomyces sp. NPDC057280]|uniref:hypothetical protein n=1 Tax=Streptomyces sp. NPDC057280 TaxID=3346081 RepID=UPI003634AB9A